jgi:hypothetical protein
MSQSQQMLGQVSPQIDAVASQMQGWGGLTTAPGLGSSALPTAEQPDTMASELEDATDFSFRDRRANMQVIGWQNGLGPFTPSPAMAGYGPNDGGYWEQPTAATQVTPINQFNPVPPS